jgi:hypothetical protein
MLCICFPCTCPIDGAACICFTLGHLQQAASAASEIAAAYAHTVNRCVDQDPSKRPTSAQLATMFAHLLLAWGIREAGGGVGPTVGVNVEELRAAAGPLSGPPAILKHSTTPSADAV